MVIKQVALDIVCGVTSTLPDTGQPEVAFAGKSNVGKSSLINGLVNSRARLRPSIFIISMMKCIWWICRDMDTQRRRKR